MSEKQPNPETEKPKSWHNTCGKCETKYEINGDNACYVDYTRKQECNFIYCKCTNCDTPTRIYDKSIGPEDANIRNIYIDDSDEYPSDHIYEEWFTANGYERPVECELTSRHEALVQKFGETITAITEQAPDLFMQVMSDPAPAQSMPQRWV